MAAATSWSELALKRGYLATVARRKGVPERVVEDLVGDAVLECLERAAKGQRFRCEATAAKGLIGSAVRGSMRQERILPGAPSEEPSETEEDRETRRQAAEWVALPQPERLARAREARIATGTSLAMSTAGYGRPRMRPSR